jgi:hypothetical protein
VHSARTVSSWIISRLPAIRQFAPINQSSAFLVTNLEWSNLDEWPKTSRMANLILRYGPIPAFRADIAKLVSQMKFVGYQDGLSIFTVIALWN